MTNMNEDTTRKQMRHFASIKGDVMVSVEITKVHVKSIDYTVYVIERKVSSMSRVNGYETRTDVTTTTEKYVYTEAMYSFLALSSEYRESNGFRVSETPTGPAVSLKVQH